METVSLQNTVVIIKLSILSSKKSTKSALPGFKNIGYISFT